MDIDVTAFEATRGGGQWHKIFRGLSEREIDLVLNHASPRIEEHHDGEVLWSQEDDLQRMVIVLSGRIASYRQLEDSAMQLVRFYDPGHIVAIESAVSVRRTSCTLVKSHIDGQYLSLETDALLHSTLLPLEKRHLLALNVINLVADEAIRFLNKAFFASAGSVTEKIMTFLERIDIREGMQSFDINMNQEEFARYLSVDRSTLSQELNRLRREGKIEYSGSVYKVLRD